jgi:hypothetical protein
MPEMQLLRLAVEPSRLSWDHADSTHTLTIHYAKPPALLAEVRLTRGAVVAPMAAVLTCPRLVAGTPHARHTKPVPLVCVAACVLVQELADSKAAAAMRAQEPPTDCRQQ